MFSVRWRILRPLGAGYLYFFRVLISSLGFFCLLWLASVLYCFGFRTLNFRIRTNLYGEFVNLDICESNFNHFYYAFVSLDSNVDLFVRRFIMWPRTKRTLPKNKVREAPIKLRGLSVFTLLNLLRELASPSNLACDKACKFGAMTPTRTSIYSYENSKNPRGRN